MVCLSEIEISAQAYACRATNEIVMTAFAIKQIFRKTECLNQFHVNMPYINRLKKVYTNTEHKMQLTSTLQLELGTLCD